MARMTTKICPVCGREYRGTDGKITCSNACRTAASRMLAKGKKPEYWLMAKAKGQKLPLVFNGSIPKKVKSAAADLNLKIEYLTPVPDEYDGERISSQIQDESIKVEVQKELTWEQKIAFNADIDQKIIQEKEKRHQAGMHPRQFKLQQEEKIADLEKQKIKF